MVVLTSEVSSICFLFTILVVRDSFSFSFGLPYHNSLYSINQETNVGIGFSSVSEYVYFTYVSVKRIKTG